MNVDAMRWCISVLVLFVITQCASSSRSSPSDSFQCPTPRLKNGRIRARGRGRIIRYSCYTDYELVGNKYSTCIRGSWDTPTPICVSTRCPSIPVPKHAVVGEKYRGAILMYFCEPGYVLVGNSEIYCDGRQWNGTTPYCRDSNAIAPRSCDFEKEGLCWWEQDPKHDFDWIRHRFDTPSSHIGTGPTHDHTLGAGNDGNYLYIEATGKLVNDTARIISPLYTANLTESGCFSFWYHMYGATIGSLNVYFKPEIDKTSRLMWTKQGNQGNQWLRGIFDLPTVNSSFQIIIEGVRGKSYVSDIAIDDIAILQGDECIVKNVTTAAPSDGDEVEVFNAMQSCRGRCVNALLETTPSSEVYTNPDVCQCTLDCAETSLCCPDYSEYCIYEYTEQMETIMPTNETTTSIISYSQTENQTSKVETEKTTASTTSTSTTQKSTTVSSMTMKTVKIIESTIPTTITRITTSFPVTRIETTVENVPTTSHVPMKMTTIKSTIPVALNEETSFFVHPTIRKTTLHKVPTQAETHILIQDARKMESSVSLSFPGIIGIVIGILTGITITTVMALVILRRRKLYKRNSNGSAFSEDSDVRFLTSDEVLDFNLARPAGEYDEM